MKLTVVFVILFIGVVLSEKFGGIDFGNSNGEWKERWRAKSLWIRRGYLGYSKQFHWKEFQYPKVKWRKNRNIFEIRITKNTGSRECC